VALAARAQRSDRTRRIGALMGYAETDPEAQAHIDVRWSASDVARAASLAKELVALQPDAILANTTLPRFQMDGDLTGPEGQ
jgi:putative ABC transport system substrate-binding protein